MSREDMPNRIYEQLKAHFESHGLKYTPHDEDQVITLTAQGDDFPIPVIIRVIGEREVLRISSPLPGEFPEDKRIDAAVAIATINEHLLNGAFIIDMSDGSVVYRVCQSFHDNDISEEQIRYLMSVVFTTTDEYNDSLFLLAKGMITLEQFIEKNNQ